MLNLLNSVLLGLQLQCVLTGAGLEIFDVPCASLGTGSNLSCFCRCLHSVLGVGLFLNQCPDAEVSRPSFCSPSAVRACVGSSGHLHLNSAVEGLAHYILLDSVILGMVMCYHLSEQKCSNTAVWHYYHSFFSLKRFIWKQKSSMTS